MLCKSLFGQPDMNDSKSATDEPSTSLAWNVHAKFEKDQVWVALNP